MTLFEKAAQTLMIPVSGKTKNDTSFTSYFREIPAGALILFQFNVASRPEEVRDFTASIQDGAVAAGMKAPPFLAIDHEGGSVWRMGPAFVRLPSASMMGHKLSSSEIMNLGKSVGREMRAVGISWILAPVVEAETTRNRNFLGSRVYSADPRIVASLTSSYIQGLESEGLLTCSKHFPGNSDADPHRGLPVLDSPRSWFETDVFPVFRQAAIAGTGSVMLSHALVPSLDADNSASLSPAVIAILKKNLSFSGIALTDDLKMKALAGTKSTQETAIIALNAGADMLMVTGSENLKALAQSIADSVISGVLPQSRLDDAVLRILMQKLKISLETEWVPQERKTRFGQINQAQADSRQVLKNSGL